MSLPNASAMLVMSSLVAASPASTLAPQDITSYYNSFVRLSPHSTRQPVPPVADLTPEAREMIAWLKNDGLPVSALAELLQVERKSVYNWLDGGNIKDHNFERLHTVYRVLRESRQTELRHLYRLFGRPLPEGRTLGELLAAEHLDETALRRALQVLWPLAKSHQEKEARRAPSTGLRGNPLLAEVPEVMAADER